MAGRKYELFHDWTSQPVFHGSPEEVAVEIRRIVASRGAHTNRAWGILVRESRPAAQRATSDGWAGAIRGHGGADGSLGMVSIRHGQHDTNWERENFDAIEQEIVAFKRRPIPVNALLKRSAVERRKEWVEKGDEARAIRDRQVSSVNKRDGMANDRMEDIAKGFTAIDEGAEYLPMEDAADAFTAYWYQPPEGYERDFRENVNAENKTRLGMQYKAKPEREWFRGYVERPDGSFKIGRVSRGDVLDMHLAQDFSPPKWKREKRDPADFKKRRGI